MKKVIYTNPNGKKEELKDVDDVKVLKKSLIDDFETYWMQGSGDGYIDYYIGHEKKSTLILEPNVKVGIYLHYIDHDKKKDLLSLNNKNKLNELIEAAEEIYASAGLFLDTKLAWNVIYDFWKDGTPSDSIKWISPSEIPDTGNW